jgi:hypothetical protein
LAHGKELLYQVVEIKHSTNHLALGKEQGLSSAFLPSVLCLAHGKELLCQVAEIKHSANHLALGKEQGSSSDIWVTFWL